MRKLKELLAVVSVTTFLILCVLGTYPAQAIEFNYAWQGNAGYSAQGSFSYDETKGYPIITPEKLKFLKISFFDPKNTLIKTYINVENGQVKNTNPYLEFNFNPATESLFSNFDVGEGTEADTDDFYLHGVVNSSLELRNLDVNVLDQNSGFITVQKIAVADPS